MRPNSSFSLAIPTSAKGSRLIIVQLDKLLYFSMGMVKPILEGRLSNNTELPMITSVMQGLMEMPLIINDDKMHVATCNRVGWEGKATTFWLLRYTTTYH